jgi:beta-lactamase class A
MSNRKQAVAWIGAVFWIGITAEGALASPPPGAFQREVARSVRTGGHSLDAVGIEAAVLNLRTGQFEWREGIGAQRKIYPASTIKTLVALAVLRRVDEGTVTLEQEIRISQSNADAECARACDRYGLGKWVSVRRLLSDMMVWSSNIATNQLMDLVGRAWINATADALGAPSLRLYRKLYVRVNAEPEIEQRNEATARGLLQLYAGIAREKNSLLTASSRRFLLVLLARCRSRNRLNHSFPPEVVFFHKTGSTSQSSSDAGFYRLDSERVLIVAALQGFRSFPPLQKIGRWLLRKWQPSAPGFEIRGYGRGGLSGH